MNFLIQGTRPRPPWFRMKRMYDIFVVCETGFRGNQLRFIFMLYYWIRLVTVRKCRRNLFSVTGKMVEFRDILRDFKRLFTDHCCERRGYVICHRSGVWGRMLWQMCSLSALQRNVLPEMYRGNGGCMFLYIDTCLLDPILSNTRTQKSSSHRLKASNLESWEDVSVHTYNHVNTQKQFLNWFLFLRPSEENTPQVRYFFM
jgi:hypothetical protein